MRRTPRTTGLSLVEMLITMVILGVLLAFLGSFFAFNQRFGGEQITSAKINNDARLAFLRISDVMAQAQYIYPAGQALTLKGTGFTETITTGAAALAVLVPSKTTYCPAAVTVDYCGFVFSIESSSPYAAILGSGSATTGVALAEYRFAGIEWDQSKLPTRTLQDPNALRSPLVDSVDTANSSLAAAADLDFAVHSNYDEATFVFPPPNPDAATLAALGQNSAALVNSVESRLQLAYNVRGKTVTAQRSNLVFARAVPRARQPE